MTAPNSYVAPRRVSQPYEHGFELVSDHSPQDGFLCIEVLTSSVSILSRYFSQDPYVNGCGGPLPRHVPLKTSEIQPADPVLAA